MDPNATLAAMLDMAAKILDTLDSGGFADKRTAEDCAECLAQEVCDLDAWLRSGGFKPDAWNK